MPRDVVVDSVRFQHQSCRNIGSPFYGDLLETALSDCHAGIPFWEILDAWPGNPLSALLSLRLLGAVHDRVLAGEAAELAVHYPRPGHAGDARAAWPRFNELIVREREFIEGRLDAEVQTNEVGRCAALLPGFLVINQRSGGLPMHLAELGASGGLNLCWDRYRYALGPSVWGDADAPLEISTAWTGESPPCVPLDVVSRRGCDISPLDLRDEANRRRLESFVWPDQFERLDLLRRAMSIASKQPIEIVRMSAGDFVDEVLASNRPGAVTVIYHSIMWIYVPEAERQRITRAIHEAGSRATTDAPLAWLRMEFVDDKQAALWLDTWPGWRGEREKLANCHYHGTSIEWLGAN